MLWPPDYPAPSPMRGAVLAHGLLPVPPFYDELFREHVPSCRGVHCLIKHRRTTCSSLTAEGPVCLNVMIHLLASLLLVDPVCPVPVLTLALLALFSPTLFPPPCAWPGCMPIDPLRAWVG